MARARNIKPAFFTNEELADCHPMARLLFINLWMLADREGRLENRQRKIKAQTFPYDDCEIADLIGQLEDAGFVFIYEAEGKSIIQINNWAKHQNPHHKEAGSGLPGFDESKHDLMTAHGQSKLGSTTIHGQSKHDSMTDHEKRAMLSSLIIGKSRAQGRYSRSHCGSDKNLMGGLATTPEKAAANYTAALAAWAKSTKINSLAYQGSSLIQVRAKLDPSLNQAWFKENASCPTDSLNLIPDSLNLIPDSLIPDSSLQSPTGSDGGKAPSQAKTKTKRKPKAKPKPPDNKKPAQSLPAKAKPKKPAKPKVEPKSSETWAAYAEAYYRRYGVEPVRNARVSAQAAQLVDRLGAEDAPLVAAFFVGHSNSYYVASGHAIGALLKDAEKIRTEWATGRRMTQTTARQADRTASNPFARMLNEERKNESQQ